MKQLVGAVKPSESAISIWNQVCLYFPRSRQDFRNGRETDMKNILSSLMTSIVLIAMMSPAIQAADGPDAVSKLFADARTQSSQLSLAWKAYTRQPGLNWTSDAAEVTRMREDLDATARTAADLNEARGQASPSQLAAMDRIVPVMLEIAENTTKAIDFLTRNQARLTSKQYKEYVEQNSDTSNRLSALVSQLVDYESRRVKLDLAKRNLELAANQAR
jgi:hypothetical protein